MGIVQRQGIKQSLTNYAATLVGAFSMIFIYSQDTDVYGFARFMIDTAFLLMPLMLLGSGAVAIKFFPEFKNEQQQHNGFLGLLFSIALFGCLLVLSVIFFLQDQILELYKDKPTYYLDQFLKIGILAVLVTIFSLFYNYTTNFKRIVFPSIFQNFIKLSLPILVFLKIQDIISINFLANGIIINYIIAIMAIVYYIYFLDGFSLKWSTRVLTKPLIQNIKSFALFSVFSGIGSMLAFRIDGIMIPTILDFKSNGAYSIAAFIGNAIAIPTYALIQITSPLLASALRENDMDQTSFLYKRSSINLLLFGMLFYILVISSIQDLFLLMPKRDFDMTIGFWIVAILGATKIFDMATSINTQIINYSKYYRFNLVAILILAVFNVGLNLLLIPKYQLYGAAFATLSSLSLFNIVKLIFIYIKFRIHPFSSNTMYVLTIAVLTYLVVYMLPSISNPLLSIVVKSSIITVIYVPIILYLKLSTEVNDLFLKAWSLVKNMIK